MTEAFETVRYFEQTDIIKWSPIPFHSDKRKQLPSNSFSPLPLYFWTHFFYVRNAEERVQDLKLLNSAEEGDWDSHSETLPVRLKAEDDERTSFTPRSPPKSALHAPWNLRSIGKGYFHQNRTLEHPSPPENNSFSVLVRCKKVRWEPEDCWSNIKSVVQQIDAVQRKQWKWWREKSPRKTQEKSFPVGRDHEEVPRDAVEKAYFHISADDRNSPLLQECKESGTVDFTAVCSESSPSCDLLRIPSVNELREAMLIEGHLLPYYAVNCENKKDLYATSCPTHRRNSHSSCCEDHSFVDSSPIITPPTSLLRSEHTECHSEELCQEEISSGMLSRFLSGQSTHHTWLIEPCVGSVESLLFYSFRAVLRIPSGNDPNPPQASGVGTLNVLPFMEKHEEQLHFAAASNSHDSICECASSVFSSRSYQISSAVVYSSFSLDYPNNCEDSGYRWSLQDLVSDVLTALWVLHFRCEVAHGDVSLQNILWRVSPLPIVATCSEDAIHTPDYSTRTENGECMREMRNVHFVLGDLEMLYPLPKGCNRKGSFSLFQNKYVAHISSQNGGRKSSTTASSPEFPEMLYCEEKASATPLSGFRGVLMYAPLELIEGNKEAHWSASNLPSASAAGDVWAFGIVLLQILLTQSYREKMMKGGHADLYRNGEKECLPFLKTHPFLWDQRRSGALSSSCLFDEVAAEQKGKNELSAWPRETSREMGSTIFEIIFLLKDFKQECTSYDATAKDKNNERNNEDIYWGVKRVLTGMYGELSHFCDGCTIHTCDERDSSHSTVMDFLSRCLHPNPARRATVEELKELTVNWDL